MVRSAQKTSHLAVALGSMETQLTHILFLVIELQAFIVDLFLITLLRLVELIEHLFVSRLALIKAILHFVTDDSHTIIHALCNPQTPLQIYS
mgnify:CR=1 FL=1